METFRFLFQRSSIFTRECFLRTKLNSLLFTIMNLIRFFEYFILIICFQPIVKNTILMQIYSVNDGFEWIVMGCGVIIIGLIIFAILIRKKLQQQQGKQQKQQQPYGQKILKQTILTILQILRLNLIIPIVFFTSLDSQTINVNASAISAINLILCLVILYPLSGMIFFNRIIIKKDILSYLYTINIESVLYACMPLLVFVKIKNAVVYNYVGLMVVLMSILIMYLRPAITYHNNKISQIGASSLISLIGLSCLSGVCQVQLIDLQRLIIFFISVLIITCLLYEIQHQRMKQILLTNNQSQVNSISFMSYNETLLYFITNYQQHKNQLKLFLFNQLQRVNTQISQQKSELQKKKSINNHNNQLVKANANAKVNEKTFSCNSKGQLLKNNQKLIKTIKQLIQKISQQKATVKHEKSTQKQIEQLYYEVIALKFQFDYNPEQVKSFQLGNKQLLKLIDFQSKYLFLYTQVLMHSPLNFSKCYFTIKYHNELVQSTENKSFIDTVFSSCLIKIIQQNLQLNYQLSNNKYNSKAYQFYQFQKQYGNLQQQIFRQSQVCDNFWKQSLQKQPNQDKLKQKIKQNYFLQKRIRKRTKQILQRFEESPFILYELIEGYSRLILNSQITDNLSMYNFFAVKFVSKLKAINKNKLKTNQQLNGNKSTIYGSYSIEKDVKVFVIDAQKQQYPIQWANNSFRSHTGMLNNNNFNKNNKNHSSESNQSKAHDSLFSLILPQLRQDHKIHIKQFIRCGQQLNYTHSSATLLYSQKQKSIQFINLQIQILPSLKNGLKLVGFIHTLQETNSNYKAELILDNQLRFVACTHSFNQKIKQILFLQDSQNNQQQQESHKHLYNFKNKQQSINDCMQVLNKNTQFQQFCRTISHQTYQQFRSIINLQNSDYSVILKAKIPYKLPYSTNTQSKVQQIKYLYRIQFLNLLTDQNLQNDQDRLKQNNIKAQRWKNQKHYSKQNFNNKLTSISKVFTNEQSKSDSLKESHITNQFHSPLKLKSQKSNNKIMTQTIKTILTPQSQNYFSLADRIVVQQAQKMQDKSQSLCLIQKNYSVISGNKKPKKIIQWRIFTYILTAILIACMVGNIVSLSQREKLYQQKQRTLFNFQQLVTNLCQSFISLREYNYYANLYSVQSEYIPFIVERLVKQQKQIQLSLKQVSKYLTQKWKGFQILPNGQTQDMYDSSFVVISNYMLSAINFITQESASEVAFPIFVIEHYMYNIEPTVVILRYFQAIYNGLYVALPQLQNVRKSMTSEIEGQLRSVFNMYYVYACIIGCLVILVFAVVSICIEIKSHTILTQTVGIFDQMSSTQRNKKIQDISKFRQLLNKISNINRNNQNPNNNKQGQLLLLTSTLKNFYKFSTTNPEGSIKSQGSNSNYNNHQRSVSDQISQVQNQLGLSNRQFVNDNNNHVQITDLNPFAQIVSNSYQTQNLQIQNKTTDNNNQTIINNRFPNLFNFSTKQKLIKILFYLLICTPSFIYFIYTLVGGIQTNQKIINQIKLTTQIHNRKVNQQLVYLMTRQTAYIQNFLNQPDWKAYVTGIIQNTYKNDRKIEKMLKLHPRQSKLGQLLEILQNGNLCNNLQIFEQKSEYYNITFTQEQCLSMGQSFMIHGFKQLIVVYLESAMEMINKYPITAEITLPVRYQFLEDQTLKRMKFILAYAEQFMSIIIQASEQDLAQQIQKYIKKSFIFTCLSILTLGILFKVVSSRWKILMSQRKLIQSVISLISLNSLSKINLQSTQASNKSLKPNKLGTYFLKIDWKFYY